MILTGDEGLRWYLGELSCLVMSAMRLSWALRN